MRMLEKEKDASFELKTDALINMDNLMLLQLNYVHMNGSYANFPEELRGLSMHGFHLNSIPLDLPMENLVALDMSYSSIESFVGSYSNPRLEKRQKVDGSCLKDKKLLGSLKILNLSFCKQLRSVGDFDQLPALETLIVRNCISLLEVCESIDQCVELFFVDLSSCDKLENLTKIIGMLKKVKTVLLDGCNLGESRIKNMDIESLEMCKDSDIGIYKGTSSSTFVRAIPSDLKLFSSSLSWSLVSLSLANNNLSDESFPMDLSCLSMLKELYLDGNPINSMPSCVRTLPRLEILSMNNCEKLKSVEHPPRTLSRLLLYSDQQQFVEKVVFDPEMSPLELSSNWRVGYTPWSYEIEGMLKIEAMVCVEEKVLRSLGWTNVDFFKERGVQTNSPESKIQTMCYEFGIFSTWYEEEKMPSWFRYRSLGTSISFTIPSSSPKNLTALNFCYVQTLKSIDEWLEFSYDPQFPRSPMITISNITKNRMWIYERHMDRVIVDGNYWVMLSHWMFGMNEMEAGDHITITVTEPDDELVKECGVSLVYDDGEEKEDVLGYYKSWNHIIGGDLSPFQTITGEYILDNMRFFADGIHLFPYHRKFVPDGPSFQEKKGMWFRALSPRKPDIIGRLGEGKGESSRSHPSHENA
ncbi:protein SUPPRESSOR OF npr1-1, CONSTITUTIVE 1 isoform X1 [Lactuca sativa]|nr:protein SUPPRESSOR OF npr1-1, CONSTITUTIVE 1 isoform X1 [Lactuca sativa]XP_042758668.1 protein SUPPRESSOR OF npr1-1, CONSTITUTIVE 1 isoform X1 [Lactuca sativa]